MNNNKFDTLNKNIRFRLDRGKLEDYTFDVPNVSDIPGFNRITQDRNKIRSEVLDQIYSLMPTDLVDDSLIASEMPSDEINRRKQAAKYFRVLFHSALTSLKEENNDDLKTLQTIIKQVGRKGRLNDILALLIRDFSRRNPNTRLVNDIEIEPDSLSAKVLESFKDFKLFLELREFFEPLIENNYIDFESIKKRIGLSSSTYSLKKDGEFKQVSSLVKTLKKIESLKSKDYPELKDIFDEVDNLTSLDLNQWIAQIKDLKDLDIEYSDYEQESIFLYDVFETFHNSKKKNRDKLKSFKSFSLFLSLREYFDPSIKIPSQGEYLDDIKCRVKLSLPSYTIKKNDDFKKPIQIYSAITKLSALNEDDFPELADIFDRVNSLSIHDMFTYFQEIKNFLIDKKNLKLNKDLQDSEEYFLLRVFEFLLRRNIGEDIVILKPNKLPLCEVLSGFESNFQQSLDNKLFSCCLTDLEVWTLRQALYKDLNKFKDSFFNEFPNYYVWVSESKHADLLKDIPVFDLWRFIPTEFRNKWNILALNNKDISYFMDELLAIKESFVDLEKKDEFFDKFPNYFDWLTKSEIGQKYFSENNSIPLHGFFTIIPPEFKEYWTVINFDFNLASTIVNEFDRLNEALKEESFSEVFFEQFPTLFDWLRETEFAQDLINNHNCSSISQIYSLLPTNFKTNNRWKFMGSKFLDFHNVMKVYKHFKSLEDKLIKSPLELRSFFVKYPTLSQYIQSLENAQEIANLFNTNVNFIFNILPNVLKKKWTIPSLITIEKDEVESSDNQILNSLTEIKISLNRINFSSLSEVQKQEFKSKYNNYFIWLYENKAILNLQNDLELCSVWNFIPDELKSIWSPISMNYQNAVMIYKALIKIDIDNMDADRLNYFQIINPNYFVWLKNNCSEIDFDFSELYLSNVWNILPDNFKMIWRRLEGKFHVAEIITDFFEEFNFSKKSIDEKNDFFNQYENYYVWLHRSPEAEAIRRLDVNNLRMVWQLLPSDLKDGWKYIHLSEQESLIFYDLFKLLEFELKEDLTSKYEFFEKYPTVVDWYVDNQLKFNLPKVFIRGIYDVLPKFFAEYWNVIDLTNKDAVFLHEKINEICIDEMNEAQKTEFFEKYPSLVDWICDLEGFSGINLSRFYNLLPAEFKDEWSFICFNYENVLELRRSIIEHSKNWNINNSYAYLEYFESRGEVFNEMKWDCIPGSLKRKFNLKLKK